jgi:dimethylamine/trimethylamine dehydrogenase
VVSYRKAQIAKLRNVDFIPNLRLDARQALEYGAEIVIVATGAHWVTDGVTAATHQPIPGADARLPHCLTPEQVMVEGKPVRGERVLVYDGDGYFVAVGLAEKLAREGKRVTYVTPFHEAAPYLNYTGEGAYVNRMLRSVGVEMMPAHVVDQISDGRVSGHHVYEERTVEWPAESTVLVTQRRSTDGLYRGLLHETGDATLTDRGVHGLYRIGDCLAPRMLAECIYDGHRLGREIDGRNASVDLPYIRENRHLGADDGDYDGFLETGRSRLQAESA